MILIGTLKVENSHFPVLFKIIGKEPIGYLIKIGIFTQHQFFDKID